MTVDNHSDNVSSPDWHVTHVPPDDLELGMLTEEHDSTFQYVYDQLDLIKRTDPDNFSKRLNAYGPLWKLSSTAQNRILDHFIRPIPHEQEQPEETEDEESTPEQDRLQELLEDTAGIPSNEARAIARGKKYSVPSPRLHAPLATHLQPSVNRNEHNLFRRETLANEVFVKTELAKGALNAIQAESQAQPEPEVEPTEKPEPIKFGIEPGGAVTHTRREHKALAMMQGEDFNVGGGLRYLKVVSNFGGGTRDERVETMTKSLNHMFDYEENARTTMESLGVLLKRISQYAGGADELLSVQPFLKTPEPAVKRALEAITYYREAMIAQGNPKARAKGPISERVERIVLSDTVDNVETDAADLYFLEEERQKLWDLQLRGRPADREQVIPKRFGAVDIVKDIPELAPIVDKRLRQSPGDASHTVAS